ncbi:MAG: class I poly(R)-hydroxyalkanoic acid synthase [Rhodospirillales bacterium]|nr:class I poly(R)-hydroxyalkanoic acid synthase [Rhodospirillales bacterium]
MSDQPAWDMKPLDLAEFSKNMAEVASRSQDLVLDFLKHQAEASGPDNPDPQNLSSAFLELTAKIMADPAKLAESQMSLWTDYLSLWQHTAKKLMGQDADPVAEPALGDRRFRNADWDENQLFDFVKQSYLLTARWVQRTVGEVEGLDEKTAKKIDFYTNQFVDAMAPTNFVLTNPEVLKATLETNGENLVHGLEHLLEDLERGKGRLSIKMTDLSAFTVGENVATTPGKVVYQNELIQLLQYEPTTKKVHKRPLLIVPPWINKFYILDLRPDNSLIKWAVAQGYTVFVISWVNPNAELAAADFEDYMKTGLLAALDAVEQATGERDVTAVGYCIGGTLLAATLAYMATTGDNRIKAATFFASLVDFSEPGELSVFIDEEQLQHIEDLMADSGVLESSRMANTFSMLRSNDLIWSFVVNNYLLGKEPFPFDLLYWNSDATNLPRAVHSFYLREMYQYNRLIEPGGITLDGVPIDLGKIETPIYLQASKEDHIAPCPSVFKATGIYGGPVKFVVAGSGHIAGVINPPEAGKYQYWVNDQKADTFSEWFEGATEHPGSWWPDWNDWLSEKSGPKVPARKPGDGKLDMIEDAPGTYVTMKGS